MNKKSIAASTVIIFSALVFAVIGSCFSAFVFDKTKILVQNVAVSTSTGIDVFQDKDLKSKTTSLKLSSMSLGLRPATGEIDAETMIPSTVSDKNTSEGYYSIVYVSASQNYKIIVKNVVIETEKNQIQVDEEKKNIFISIKDVKNSTKSLEKSETEIVLFEDVAQTQKLTFLIWLSSFADEVLEGAKISFEICFEAV